MTHLVLKNIFMHELYDIVFFYEMKIYPDYFLQHILIFKTHFFIRNIRSLIMSEYIKIS